MDLNVTFPADPWFAAVVRDVVIYGARQAGVGDAEASAFGRQVEDAVRQEVAGCPPHADVTVAVRRRHGPMEVVITAGRVPRTLAMDLTEQ